MGKGEAVQIYPGKGIWGVIKMIREVHHVVQRVLSELTSTAHDG